MRRVRSDTAEPTREPLAPMSDDHARPIPQRGGSDASDDVYVVDTRRPSRPSRAAPAPAAPAAGAYDEYGRPVTPAGPPAGGAPPRAPRAPRRPGGGRRVVRA